MSVGPGQSSLGSGAAALGPLGSARRTAVAQTELPVEFRAAPALRIAAMAFGLLSGLVTAWQLALFLRSGAARELAAAAVCSVPALVAAVVLRRRVVVQPDAMVSVSLFRTSRIAWASVRRLDQTRSAFRVYTAEGIISAGLIAAPQRDRLMRLILQQGKLTMAAGDLPWGLRARYVPRAQPIEFVQR